MNGRTFPFWIVSQRRGLVLKPVEVPGMPGVIAAFRSAEEAAAFMSSRGEKSWENRLISRATLTEVKDSLKHLGLRGFYFDPDGRQNGKDITIEQLLKA